MTKLPRHIDRNVLRAMKQLDIPWVVEKRRNHYFLVVDGCPAICISGNSSKPNTFLVQKSLRSIRKLTGSI